MAALDHVGADRNIDVQLKVVLLRCPKFYQVPQDKAHGGINE